MQNNNYPNIINSLDSDIKKYPSYLIQRGLDLALSLINESCENLEFAKKYILHCETSKFHYGSLFADHSKDRLYYFSEKGLLYVWRITNGQEIENINCNTKNESSRLYGLIKAYLVSQGRKILIHRSGTAELYYLESQKDPYFEFSENTIFPVFTTSSGYPLIEIDDGDKTLIAFEVYSEEDCQNQIKVMNFDSFDWILQGKLYFDSVDSMALNSKESILAVAGWDVFDGCDAQGNDLFESSIKVWNLKSKILLLILDKEINTETPSVDLKISFDGKYLIGMSKFYEKDGSVIKIWDLEQGGNLLLCWDCEGIQDFIFKDTYLVLRTSKNEIRVLCIKPEITINRAIKKDCKITYFDFDLYSKILVCGDEDGIITLYNLNSDQEVSILKGHDYPITDIILNLTEKMLISKDRQGIIVHWNILDGK
jgi:WD40 repeat protein